MGKAKPALVQMRAYLPESAIKRVEKIAAKRKVSLSVLLTEYLSEAHAIGSFSLPAGRGDWAVRHLHVPRSLYKDLQARAKKLDARPWDLISAILLAAIHKS